MRELRGVGARQQAVLAQAAEDIVDTWDYINNRPYLETMRIEAAYWRNKMEQAYDPVEYAKYAMNCEFYEAYIREPIYGTEENPNLRRT